MNISESNALADLIHWLEGDTQRDAQKALDFLAARAEKALQLTLTTPALTNTEIVHKNPNIHPLTTTIAETYLQGITKQEVVARAGRLRYALTVGEAHQITDEISNVSLRSFA